MASASIAQSSSTPLLLPGGLAYDAQGNLYFTETSGNVIRKLSQSGVITLLAGTGTQGFAGDGGPATAAMLDNPGGVAVDSLGNVYVADTHNHRIREVIAATGVIQTIAGTGLPEFGRDNLAATITAIDLPSALAFAPDGGLLFADARTHVLRRIDPTSHTITTLAGDGTQGSSGDGGPAVNASLDSPAGLAIDAAGDIFFSDTHNQRVRRIDHATGIITTVAGTGLPGYSSGLATASRLSLPRGLAVDSSGALFLVDAANQRIRRVDPATGQITTIAGSGAEGFAGDGDLASAALLDTPRGVVLSSAGLPILTDSENARVRLVDAAGIIHTIAGSGAVVLGPGNPVAGGLALSGPATAVYGTGTATATLAAPAAAGSVTLLDRGVYLAVAPLIGNSAGFSLASLQAGAHTLTASFPGDSAHPATVSPPLGVTITPAPLTASPYPAAITYGLVPPALTGTLTGVLSQDATAVRVGFSSAATLLSPAGSYPIAATLSGSAAGNYTLTNVPAQLTITKAASTVSLNSSLLAQVASTTSGIPGGTLILLDGGAPASSLAVAASGQAQFSSATLSNGSHTLSATYLGDNNFLSSTSAPVLINIGPATSADFALTTTQPSLTVQAGAIATFPFTVTPVNGTLSSPIQFAVSGLPAGATALFSPAYLPPGSLPGTFTLSIQTTKVAGLVVPGGLVLACIFSIVWVPRRRRRAALTGVFLISTLGCGDRINNFGQGSSTRTYNITVTATATSNSGATLLHSSVVVLTTQ